jgi:hypothetical protein
LSYWKIIKSDAENPFSKYLREMRLEITKYLELIDTENINITTN